MHDPKGCWRECLAATIAIFCTLGLNFNAFTVYLPYLTELLSLAPAQSSGFLTIRNLFAVGAVYLAKYYYEKLEIHVGLTLIILLNAFGVYLYSIVSGFPGLCIGAAVSGLCYGIGGMYPATLLMHRWFPVHESLALGICSSSSGLAATVGAPILTVLIERFSMKTAIYCEMGFIAACAVLCLILVRNYPSHGPVYVPPKAPAATRRQPIRLSWMFPAAAALGIFTGGFSYLTIHYSTEGLRPYEISTIVAVAGFALLLSKFLFGELVALRGAYRTNRLFLATAILGSAGLALGAAGGYGIALISAIIFGIGNSLPTVGVAVYAKDLSDSATFAATQQQYQTAMQAGMLISTLIPGVLATVTGNYRGFFAILAGLSVFAAVVIQRTYRNRV